MDNLGGFQSLNAPFGRPSKSRKSRSRSRRRASLSFDKQSSSDSSDYASAGSKTLVHNQNGHQDIAFSLMMERKSRESRRSPDSQLQPLSPLTLQDIRHGDVLLNWRGQVENDRHLQKRMIRATRKKRRSNTVSPSPHRVPNDDEPVLYLPSEGSFSERSRIDPTSVKKSAAQRKHYLTVHQRTSDPWDTSNERGNYSNPFPKQHNHSTSSLAQYMRDYNNRQQKRSISPAPRKASEVQRRPELPKFVQRSLRKTASEPDEIYTDERAKAEEIQEILRTLNFQRFQISQQNAASPSRSPNLRTYSRNNSITSPVSPDELWGDSNSPTTILSVPVNSPTKQLISTVPFPYRNSGDMRAVNRAVENLVKTSSTEQIFTDIEELKEAAYSIEVLSRNSRHRIGDHPNKNQHQQSFDSGDSASEIMSPGPGVSMSASGVDISRSSRRETGNTLPRRSGLTTRTTAAGHPRGVMQFLPSVRTSDFYSRSAYETYMVNKQRRSHSSLDTGDGDWSEDEPMMISQLRGQSVDIGSNLNNCEPVYPVNMSNSMHVSSSYHDIDGLRRKASVPDQCLYDATSLGHGEKGPLTKVNFSIGGPNSVTGWNKSLVAMPGSPSRLNSLTLGPPKSAPPHGMDPTSANHHYRNGQPPPLNRYTSFNTGQPGQIGRHRNRQYTSDKHGHAFSDTESMENSFSRFGRLLKSLKTSRQGSPDHDVLSPASSDSPLSSPIPSNYATLRAEPSSRMRPSPSASFPRSELIGNHVVRSVSTSAAPGVLSDSESSMNQADIMIWRRRSKGSLRKHEDTRSHIVKELFDTEASYVESLQLLVEKYLRPLKRPELCSLVEPAFVDEIFFQIPEILGHHELFLAALKSRLDHWDNKQTIGDIILNNFTKQSLIDTYTSFINNWKNAKQAIRNACQAKPSFAKYLERCSREHRNKLTLDALLIMPVQRIPRYELLIKEFLKHTSVEHPDYSILIKAQKELHDLATTINKVEAEAGLSQQMQQRLREIEAIVEGLDDLVSHDRIFYRYDIVTVSTQFGRKERCMFLFSDQLIITSIKRKSTATLRKASNLNVSSGPNFLECHKFKLLMKISLEDLEVTKNCLPLLNKLQDELSQLQEDLRILGKIFELAALLKSPHDSADKELDDLKTIVRSQMTERQHEMTTNPVLTSLDLLVTTEEGLETLTVAFSSADKRVVWEKSFNESKESLMSTLSRRPPPTFLKPVAVQRTRAGVTLTCAAATMGRNELGYPNVWLCNSDGFVGQVCILRLTPEPDMSSCNGIANSRILTVCGVPDYKIHWLDFLLMYSNFPGRKRTLSQKKQKEIAEQKSIGLQLNIPDSQSSKLELESDSSADESSSTTTQTDPKDKTPVPEVNGTPESSELVTVTVSPDSERESRDHLLPSMWLGTEDGCIHIYNYNDNVRTTKNKLKVQHNTAINALIFSDDKVFAALGNAQVVVYSRNDEGAWNVEDTETLVCDDLDVQITIMTNVTNKIWCVAQNKIFILNPSTKHFEQNFSVVQNAEAGISCVAVSGLGVWFSIAGSAVVKLYHALSYECLSEFNVSPSVTKILAGTDDIIRQHKLGCLRVTALLCCKDLLWIGTSAGVILNLPLPHLAPNATKFHNLPGLYTCPVGHVGTSRFLICVDLQAQNMSRSNSTAAFNPTTFPDHPRRRQSLNVAAMQQGKVYVISGGDGFEDFQDMDTDEADETVGKQDSVNYVLLWEV